MLFRSACPNQRLHPSTRISVSARQCHCSVTTIALHGSHGILTVSAIGFAVRLSLDSTDPGLINIARETLVLWRTGIPPVLSLLIPTFAFPEALPDVTTRLRRRRNAPLPILFFNAIPRLRCLPYTRLLSTPGLSTSELLRTL